MSATPVRLGNQIYLLPEINGRILLRINDVLYEADEIVPPSQFPEMAKEKKHDARSVAIKCLVHEYGPNRVRWPELGRSYVEQ